MVPIAAGNLKYYIEVEGDLIVSKLTPTMNIYEEFEEVSQELHEVLTSFPYKFERDEEDNIINLTAIPQDSFVIPITAEERINQLEDMVLMLMEVM